jgi:hypothetical protein
MDDRFRVPVIVWVLFLMLGLLGLAYLLTLPSIFQFLFGARPEALLAVADANVTVASGVSTVWRFLSPLLQLIIVLIILHWFLARMGIDLTLNNAVFDLNVQSVLAFLIVGTFCISTLIGYTIEGLKELSLVVVGFYFGTRARLREGPPRPVSTQQP